METTSVVFEHDFDEAMLAQIDTLRTVRLNMAETMLHNLHATAAELMERGLADGVSADELKAELTTRISTLRARLQHPDVVYADEIDLYVDLLEKTELDDEGVMHLED